ncbi:hypothetical protein PM3016_571 [Paenibacillus mucilaginosus 3016]|uniref:Uncharacterized protein n=1 Tax=Paenibacillus mucilaginosus 3016 TaxID=1116391 RepID=H6NSZ7_9BACL|nr:hypothetical protein PM3016_571 [Paenibacillus mucilaginosus 3016]
MIYTAARLKTHQCLAFSLRFALAADSHYITGACIEREFLGGHLAAAVRTALPAGRLGIPLAESGIGVFAPSMQRKEYGCQEH